MQYLQVMNGKILIEEFQFYVIMSTVNSRNKWGKAMCKDYKLPLVVYRC